METKIDIIVPVYNVEPYLQQCLNSLQIQTLKEIRIICIDDGSTDRSSQILHDFAQIDSRFQVVTKKNTGYGASVNYGLSLTQASYIGIVEPDDFVDPFCFERLYTLATIANGMDIAKCAYFNFYDNADGTHRIEASDSSKLESHLVPFEIEQYPKLLIYHPSIWSAIYSRTFLEKYALRFVEAPGAAWTDNPFFISSMCRAQKIIWSNEKHYYYRRTNPNCSSNLKDGSIPLLRALEILNAVENDLLVGSGALRMIIKRCLMYIQLVIESPAYIPERDVPLIREIISHIPQKYINEDFFTNQERALYKIYCTNT